MSRYLLIRVVSREMKREKPITVKGLLDNGSRLSPPNNDDYGESKLTSISKWAWVRFGYLG